MHVLTRRFLIFTSLVGLLIGGYSHGSGAGHLILDLETLEARLDGTALHATEVTGAYVGPIDDELFVAIVVDNATGSEDAQSVRGYVCNREVGVWLEGEVNGNEVTLSSDDEVIQIEATIGADDVFGIAHLGEAEPQLFTAKLAKGGAGLYRAQAQVDGADRTAGWIVLEDGRQRGSLDGKGNDVCPCGGGELL